MGTNSMMTLEEFGHYTNVFTRGVDQSIKYHEQYEKDSTFVMTIREVLTEPFLVVIPDELLDIKVYFFSNSILPLGWITYEEDGIGIACNVFFSRYMIRIIFHELKHLIDAYFGYPNVNLDPNMDVPGYEETREKLGRSKYRRLPEERRAGYAEKALIKQAYKIYVRENS